MSTVILDRVFVKITTSDGDHWNSLINTTIEGAKKYYMGQRFERRDETLGGPVVSVELLETVIPAKEPEHAR